MSDLTVDTVIDTALLLCKNPQRIRNLGLIADALKEALPTVDDRVLWLSIGLVVGEDATRDDEQPSVPTAYPTAGAYPLQPEPEETK